MPSASAGLELPATSLMAPLLLAIPLSWSPLFWAPAVPDDPGGGARYLGGIMCRKHRPDTSRVGGWQYESGPCPRRFFCLRGGTFGVGEQVLFANRSPQSLASGVVRP